MDDDDIWTLIDFSDPGEKPEPGTMYSAKIPVKEAASAKAGAVLVDGKCSRCGRELSKRGAHFHLKACK